MIINTTKAMAVATSDAMQPKCAQQLKADCQASADRNIRCAVRLEWTIASSLVCNLTD